MNIATRIFGIRKSKDTPDSAILESFVYCSDFSKS